MRRLALLGGGFSLGIFLGQYLLPLSSSASAASDALPAGEKDVRLSEIMSANSSAFSDD